MRVGGSVERGIVATVLALLVVIGSGCGAATTDGTGTANQTLPAPGTLGTVPHGQGTGASTPGSVPGTIPSPYCAAMRQADELAKTDHEQKVMPSDAQVEALQAARALAPEEVAGYIDTIIAVITTGRSTPGNTYVDIIAVLRDGARRDVVIVEQDLFQRCGFSFAGIGVATPAESRSSTNPTSTSTPGDAQVTYACDSLAEDFTGDADKKDSFYSVKKHLCATNRSSPWLHAALQAQWMTNEKDSHPVWQVTSGDAALQGSGALGLCSALDSYLRSVGQANAEISVGGSGAGSVGGATKAPTSTCVSS